MIDLWPLLKIILVFGSVIVLMRFKANIGFALLIGSLFLALLSNLPFDRLVSIGLEGAFSTKTIILLLMIVLIAVFNDTLKREKKLEGLTASFSEIIPSKRLAMIFFPGVIALLPMPGGAYFSAPMVREAAKRTNLSASVQATINYWFRHVWEFSWPFYPTMLWICQTYDYQLTSFLVKMMPFSFVAIISGWLVLLRRIRHRSLAKAKKEALLRFLKALAPIALLITLVISFEIVLPLFGKRLGINFPSNIGFVFSLLIVLAVVWTRAKFGWQDIQSLFISKSTGKLAVIVLGVMVFQTMLVQSGSAAEIGTFFADLGIPFVLLAVILPLLVGILLGYSLGAVSATLPIVLAAGGISLTSPQLLPAVMLCYVSAFWGVLLSPVHSCFVLTREYFEARWSEMYRYVFVTYIPLILGAVFLYQGFT